MQKQLGTTLSARLEKVVVEQRRQRGVKKGKAERYLCNRFGWIRYGGRAREM
jgi:hypothetical protein